MPVPKKSLYFHQLLSFIFFLFLVICRGIYLPLWFNFIFPLWIYCYDMWKVLLAMIGHFWNGVTSYNIPNLLLLRIKLFSTVKLPICSGILCNLLSDKSRVLKFFVRLYKSSGNCKKRTRFFKYQNTMCKIVLTNKSKNV